MHQLADRLIQNNPLKIQDRQYFQKLKQSQLKYRSTQPNSYLLLFFTDWNNKNAENNIHYESQWPALRDLCRIQQLCLAGWKERYRSRRRSFQGEDLINLFHGVQCRFGGFFDLSIEMIGLKVVDGGDYRLLVIAAIPA